MRDVGVDALQFFGFDLPLDLELAQIAQQGALVGGEPIGFALQRLQPLGRAPRQRLGPRPLGQRLRGSHEKTAEIAKIAEKTFLSVLRGLPGFFLEDRFAIYI